MSGLTCTSDKPACLGTAGFDSLIGSPLTAELKKAIEQIMTLHWDMAACKCPLCIAARDNGLGPMEEHLGSLNEVRGWIGSGM